MTPLASLSAGGDHAMLTLIELRDFGITLIGGPLGADFKNSINKLLTNFKPLSLKVDNKKHHSHQRIDLLPTR